MHSKSKLSPRLIYCTFFSYSTLPNILPWATRMVNSSYSPLQVFRQSHDLDSSYFLNIFGSTVQPEIRTLASYRSYKKRSTVTEVAQTLRESSLKYCFQLSNINPNTDFSPKRSQKSTVTHEERRKRKDEKEANHNNYGFRSEKNRNQQLLYEEICQWNNP